MKQIRNLNISKTGLIIALIASGLPIAGFFYLLLYAALIINSSGLALDAAKVLIMFHGVEEFTTWAFYVIAMYTPDKRDVIERKGKDLFSNG